MLFALHAGGCLPAPSLSVQLYHPQSGLVRNCTARESAARDIPSLAEAVETCARQLEARGFVRADHARPPAE